jgi:hypothetical protein
MTLTDGTVVVDRPLSPIRQYPTPFLPTEARYTCTLKSEEHAVLQGQPPHQLIFIEIHDMDKDTRYAIVKMPNEKDVRISDTGKMGFLMDAIQRSLKQHAKDVLGITDEMFEPKCADVRA